MERLDEKYFASRADEVAKDLLGRDIICNLPGVGKVRIKLTEVAAYEGTTKKSSDVLNYSAGIVSISTKFGKRLLDIATSEKDRPSCVTLRSGILEDKLVRGPGNLTEALGINKENKDLVEGKYVSSNIIWIEGESVDESKIKKSRGNSPNCLGIYRI